MVWFQCEDCGENLKKPKLPNHFRCCSAYKLSCIDCGVTFSQETVQGHNQCMTEMEKYGPKGLGGKPSTPNAKNKKNQDVDINVGLSERPPWYCRLCNTNATSRQALLLHADGKKHRGKSRAIQAANQASKQTEESTPNINVSAGNTQKDELPIHKDGKQSNGHDTTNVISENKSSEVENGNIVSNKKRKFDPSENEHATKKAEHDSFADLENRKCISAEKDFKKKIKWKKLITSALKSCPDGVMKMRKLQKHVLEAIKESGITEDEAKLTDLLKQKIDSSSRFSVDKKYVRLASRD